MKKRLISILMTLALCLTLVPSAVLAANGVLSGTGTKENPYLIYDDKDLLAFADIVNGTNKATRNTAACAKVMANIKKEPEAGEQYGKLTVPSMGSQANPYTGTFTSVDDVAIEYLDMNQPEKNQVGLFGYIENATIENVHLKNPVVVGDTEVGGLVGVAVNSSIKNCKVSSTRRYDFEVRGSESVGGLVGRSEDSTITGCQNSTSVYLIVTGKKPARHKLGGIVGVATLSKNGTNPVLLSNCRNEGAITCTTQNDYECTGGIVGRLVSDNANYRAGVKNCVNEGDVFSIEAGTGGIVGYAQNASIELCQNKNYVTGTTGVGGIAGYAFYGTQILSCDNYGQVAGRVYSDTSATNPKTVTPFNIGGIVGSVYNPRNTSHLFEDGTYDCDTLPVYSYNRDSLIYNCNNKGEVYCDGDYEEQLGTIVFLPENPAVPYAVSLSIGSMTGGIVGFAADSAYFEEEGNVVCIEKCTNFKKIKGSTNKGNATYTGGILGCGKNVAVVNCANDGGTVEDADVKTDDTIHEEIGGYSYTVHFNANGGTVATGESLALTQNDVLEKPTDPTRAGSAFDGWYKDQALSSRFDFAKDKVNASMTLYANWRENNYTIHFDANGGTAVADKTGVKWTDNILDGVPVPTREGYWFAGWDFSGNDVLADTTLADLTSDDTEPEFTLTARWEEIITITAPFTTTVQQGDTVVPEKTEFALEVVAANTGEEKGADVTVSGTVMTNGAGKYSGTLTLRGTFRQLWNLLCEGAFVQQVDGKEANWLYDDTVWGLLLREEAALVSGTENTLPAYSLVILPATREETENGWHYELGEEGVAVEQMTFTNVYTKHAHVYTKKQDKDSHWDACVCGTVQGKEPHRFGDWNVTKEASETAAGEKERCCSVCAYTETAEIAKLSKTDSPQTGDTGHWMWWALLLAMAVAGTIGLGLVPAPQKTGWYHR